MVFIIHRILFVLFLFGRSRGGRRTSDRREEEKSRFGGAQEKGNRESFTGAPVAVFLEREKLSSRRRSRKTLD